MFTDENIKIRTTGVANQVLFYIFSCDNFEVYKDSVAARLSLLILVDVDVEEWKLKIEDHDCVWNKEEKNWIIR